VKKPVANWKFLMPTGESKYMFLIATDNSCLSLTTAIRSHM